MKICICATHFEQYNGYSKVAYELVKRLCLHDGINVTYFGFQNFPSSAPKQGRSLPGSVVVYDAFKHEDPSKNGKGFGIESVKDYFTENEFDAVIIYNDMIVINAFLDKLKEIPDRKFKIIAYLDQVYLYQKRHFIRSVNENCDGVMAFTPEWKDSLVEQGITLPIIDLRHGIDKKTYFPIPQRLARKYFGLSETDFIVMNLNRNQPRKRWDICLKAVADAVSRVHDSDNDRTFKFLIATALTGAWNLLEVYERELKKRGMTLEQGKKHLIVIDAPQKLSDEEVNILMNCADVGINTCDGEGFGLCQFEQAFLGIPQIVPKLGGFVDFLGEDRAFLCDPILNYYIDGYRDGVGGEAQICDYSDFTEGMIVLYKNPEMRKEYGDKSRNYINETAEYDWDVLASKLKEFIKSIVAPKVEEVPEEAPPDPLDVNKIQSETEESEDAISMKDIKKQLRALQMMISKFESDDVPSPKAD